MTRTAAAALAFVVAAALAGCSDDEPGAAPGPDAPTATTTPSAPRTFPAGTEDLCGAFATAYDAFAEVGGQYGDAAEVRPELVEAFHQWGQDLADAELPPDVTRDQRDGIAIMVQQLLAVPDDARGRDLRAVDEDLTAGEAQLVRSVSAYVEDTCGLTS